MIFKVNVVIIQYFKFWCKHKYRCSPPVRQAAPQLSECVRRFLFLSKKNIKDFQDSSSSGRSVNDILWRLSEGEVKPSVPFFVFSFLLFFAFKLSRCPVKWRRAARSSRFAHSNTFCKRPSASDNVIVLIQSWKPHC